MTSRSKFLIPPSYIKIAADMGERIEDGEYLPGSRVPPCMRLAEEYRVSVSTIERAFILLRERGQIFSKQGIGVFVRKTPEESG